METTTEIAVIMPDEFLPVTSKSGIEKAETYAATFAPFMIEIKTLSNKVINLNRETPSALDAKLAREVRLALVKNRTATAKQKDNSKAALLAEGNLIQNLHNVVVNTSQLIEADMESVEKYAENKEKERVESLRLSRLELLCEYVEDANIYPLGTMSEDAFSELLTGSKLLHEKRIEAARLAEENRIKEENARLEEQARIRAENERLKSEAEEKEKLLAVERIEAKRIADKLEAENKKKLAAIEESNRVAREKAAKEQAERDAKAAAELKAQKDAADKLAKQLAGKKEDERIEAERIAKIESERVAAEKKAAKAPVKEKLSVAINSLALTLPESEVTQELMDKFNGFKTWALSKVNSL